MRDIETGSLWSHLLGRCMEGDLKGRALRILPAVMTTWQDWRRTHPRSQVLDLPRTSRGYDRAIYRHAERFVLGAWIGGEAKAYPFPALERLGAIADEIGGVPVLAVYDPESTRSCLYERRVEGTILTFEGRPSGGLLVDRETKSRWDLRTGDAVEGPRKGRRMPMLPGIVSFRRAWAVFHPDSAYYEAPAE